jgi:hypothetical protein
MRMNWKNISVEARDERICDPELSFIEILDSQGLNQSLVVTPFAGAHGAPQL